MTKILLLDPDEQTRSEMKTCLATRGYSVVEAASKSEALRIVEDHRGPWVLFINHQIPETGGVQICRHIRQLVRDTPPYIILMGNNGSRAEIAQGIRAGADEYLSKPIAPDLLRNRVRAAARIVAKTETPSAVVLKGLKDGIAHGSGELIVRDGPRVFRVLFQNHRIVFVSGAGERSSLRGVLQAHGLPSEDVNAAIEEARTTGRGFFDILLTWNLITADQLKSLTRGWIERRLTSLLHSDAPQVLFVPQEYKGSRQDFAFELHEVLADVTVLEPHGANGEENNVTSVFPLSGTHAAWEGAFFQNKDPLAVVRKRLEEILAIEGAIVTAAIHRESGRCEGWIGKPLDPEAVWAAVNMFNTMHRAGDQPEELCFSTQGVIHLARPLDEHGMVIVYLAVRRPVASLGLFRAAFAKVCAPPLHLTSLSRSLKTELEGPVSQPKKKGQ